MGYTTEFAGAFRCYHAPDPQLASFLAGILDGDLGAMRPLTDWLNDEGDPRGDDVARLAVQGTNDPEEFWRLFGLRPKHAAYLLAFSQTRRMKRDPEKAKGLPDPVRLAAGLPIGEEGGYFVGGGGFMGQEIDNSVVEDVPPLGQPGRWCQWVPTEEGTALLWDGGEKFYRYVAWLRYLIEHFLRPWGYLLQGTVTWQGEVEEDRGKIAVADNQILVPNPKEWQPQLYD